VYQLGGIIVSFATILLEASAGYSDDIWLNVLIQA